MINNLTGPTDPINPADTWDRLWEQVTIEEEFWVKVKQSTIQSRIDLVVYDIKDADMYFPEAEIQGVLKGGNISVNSGSAVRRTASFELIPSLYKREQEIEEWEEENGYAYYVHLNGDLAKWLTKKIRVILWIRDYWYGTDPNDNDAGTWYPFNMGMFMINSANSSYDAQNNTLSIELTDMMAMLDGTLNGQVGGVISTVIPAYEEDPETGEPISHNSIKKAIESVCDRAGLSGWQYIIDEIGEHMAFPMFNMSGWEQYREDHPLWNMIPYDLEFSTGCTMWSIIEELVNLYPNFDCAFDKNGVLRARLIPSSEYTLNCFGFSEYYDLIISEQISTDLSTVRNICEVWGEGMDTDWYTDDVTQGKYVVYVIQVTKPDDGGNFYVDLKYIIQEKTIKTERINCYRNLSTNIDWEELKILYENQTFSIKALRDSMVYNNNTYNTDQTIYTCPYEEIGIMSNVPDPNYTYDSTLNFSCLNPYYVSSTAQTLMSIDNKAIKKTINGGAIAVEWHNIGDYPRYTLVLISTLENNVLINWTPDYEIFTTSETIDGVTWYLTTLQNVSLTDDANKTIPLLDRVYTASTNPRQAIIDILSISRYTIGQVIAETVTPYQAVITRTSDLDVYEVPLEGYPTAYRTGDRIAVDFRNTNIANQMMRINNLDPLPIINQMDKMPVGANFFNTEHTHVFQIVKEKGTKEVDVIPESHLINDKNMTSNVSELGTASQYNAASGVEAWYAFPSNKSWTSGSSGAYVQFTFAEPVTITMFHFSGRKNRTYWGNVLISQDGIEFTSLFEFHFGSGLNIFDNHGDFETFTCKSFRLQFTEEGAELSQLTILGYKNSEVTTAEEIIFIQKFYYLGVAQAHAIDVITDGTIIENGWWDPGDNEHKGRYYDKYSQEYYERILNCDVVSLTVRKDSPFVVQKLGDRIDVKEGGEFANITSNELALERAQYENWKNARLSDNVTITTKLLPFVEPFMKIDYKKANSKEKRDYIVNSVSHDFDNGTTTIQMATFYPLYKSNPGNNSAMTYNYMAGYRNEDLSGDEDEIF